MVVATTAGRRAEVDSTTDLSEYRRLMIESAVPLEVTAAADQPFLGSIDACEVDDITIMRVRSVAQRVRRTGDSCRRAPSDLVKVLVQRTGEAVAEQQGRRTRVAPRSLAFYDTSTPYEVVQRHPFTADALLVPQELFRGGRAVTKLLEGRALPADSGPAAMFVSYLDDLRSRMRECSPDAVSHCTTILLELLQVAVVEASTPSLSGPALRVQITDWIERHLAQEDLAPASIAAAHGISVRYLHQLFHESGCGVAGYVRSRRLHRIHNDLLDAALGHRTVAAVGARWGIADPAHLNRLFRAEFGRTPGQVRREGFARRDVQDVVHAYPTVGRTESPSVRAARR